MYNASQNVYISHLVGNLTLGHKRYSLANAGYLAGSLMQTNFSFCTGTTTQPSLMFGWPIQA